MFTHVCTTCVAQAPRLDQNTCNPFTVCLYIFLVQDIQGIQKRKVKEIDELRDLELKKNNFKQELENSYLEIKNVPEFLEKITKDDRTEEESVEAKQKLEHMEMHTQSAKTARQLSLEYEMPISQIPENISTRRESLLQQLKQLRIGQSTNNEPLWHHKLMKKKYTVVYKQYTSSDIMAALEEVKKGKSALQVSKYFNIPSRTLYDKAKKMGITTQRNLTNKSLIKKLDVAFD